MGIFCRSFDRKNSSESLFNKDVIDCGHESINKEFADGKEAEEYLADTKNSIIDNIENKQTKKELCTYVFNIINEVKSQCSPVEDYMRILAIRHYFISGESKTDRLFQEEFKNKNNEVIIHKTYGRIGKYKYLKTLDIIRKELMKIT